MARISPIRRPLAGSAVALLLVAVCVLGASQEGYATDTSTTVDELPLTQDLHVPSYDHWPLTVYPFGEGGRILLGDNGVVTVSEAPAKAEVELRRSWVGQGIDDCSTYEGTCLTIAESELYATGTTNEAGQVAFPIDGSEYTEPGVVAWQAVVKDPATGRWGTTDTMVRHIAVPQEASEVKLRLVNQLAGLTNTFTNGNTHTGGMAWVDVNNDYWPDLFIVSSANTPNYLYLNRGDGTFLNASEKVVKPDMAMECAGARYADIDNDGDYDLMVPVDNATQMISSAPQSYHGGPNYLFRNDGNLEFVDVAEEAGVLDPLFRRNSDASFADFNRDGCIDLYLVNWAMATLPAGDNYDRILEGDCSGGFTDVTSKAGPDGLGRDGLVAFWFDADLDLWPELYVANNSDIDAPPDYDPDDVFYKNEGGVFTDVTDQYPVGQDARAAMGIDVGDIDHDGDWDMYVTDVWILGPRPKGNALYLGNPDGSLSENVCQDRGVCFGYNSWPTNFADFDNDGHVDLWVGSSRGDAYDYLYLNDGEGYFTAYAQDVFQGNIVRAGSVADYDGDGDMDIFMWRQRAPSLLFRNDLENGNHHIAFKLFGSVSTADAIGATAFLTVDGVTDMRRVTGGDSAHSQRDAIMTFGLGTHDTIDELEIRWPSGIVQTFTDLPIDQLHFIHEEDGLIEEELVTADAFYEQSTNDFYVSVNTNFGGRSKLHIVETNADLPWNLEAFRYDWGTRSASPPAEVTIVSERGGSWTVPVTVLP